MKRELKSKGKPFNPTFESAHLAGPQIIEKALTAKNGEAFKRLWNGEISGYNSASEADLALCNMLAFWTGKDNAMMDTLFRQSALMRNKWDERHGADTYGNMTINKAIAITSEVYSPSHRIKDKDDFCAETKDEKDDELNAFYSETGYFVKNVCLWKYCKEDEKMLANFVPIPKEVIYKDDGLTVESWFKIAAVKAGTRALPEAYIGTSEFTSMSWVMKHWGFSANISPGVSVKDYLRHAIVEVGGRHALQKTGEFSAEDKKNMAKQFEKASSVILKWQCPSCGGKRIKLINGDINSYAHNPASESDNQQVGGLFNHLFSFLRNKNVQSSEKKSNCDLVRCERCLKVLLYKWQVQINK